MRFFGANIGDCPHTEGLYKASRIAEMAGFKTFVCRPNSKNDYILGKINSFNPDFIGFSYRLSPDKGFIQLKIIMQLLDIHGLLNKKDGSKRMIAFSGLPETLRIIETRKHDFRVPVFLVPQVSNPLDQLNIVFNFFDLHESVRDFIVSELKEELFPPRINILDQLADEVIAKETYRLMPPLPVPDQLGRKSYIQRMKQSNYPMIRSHFGIPDESIMPTVEGIKELAKARVIDEISIGSSDLSQRYYGMHNEFKKRKNDGGVPYKDKLDLAMLFKASRNGNFPSCKPYAHTTGILAFIDDCVETGMLIGAHQAIPLFWFNQLDGRGSVPVEESVNEHVMAVKKLASLGIPVEMNDPNQWSSRWAHDTVVVADYGLITAVMLENGVKDIILQMQFNKPVETSDYADIAKMITASELAGRMKKSAKREVNIYHETRTGIEYFSTNIDTAKWQLARSTLLQMFLNPDIIHLVSYCEAVHIATVNDIIESSQIIRKAVDVYRAYEPELRKFQTDPIVLERKEFLREESDYLIRRIAQIDKDYKPDESITKVLSKPSIIFKSIEKRYMAAPGIMNPEFKTEFLITKPMKNGFFNAVDFKTGKLLREHERLSNPLYIKH